MIVHKTKWQQYEWMKGTYSSLGDDKVIVKDNWTAIFCNLQAKMVGTLQGTCVVLRSAKRKGYMDKVRKLQNTPKELIGCNVLKVKRR
jgi:hypothetical protein